MGAYFLHSGATPRGLEDSEPLVSAACTERTSKLPKVSSSDRSIIFKTMTDSRTDSWGSGARVALSSKRESCPHLRSGHLPRQRFRGSWPRKPRPSLSLLPPASFQTSFLNSKHLRKHVCSRSRFSRHFRMKLYEAPSLLSRAARDHPPLMPPP